MRIAITGANSSVGQAFLAYLLKQADINVAVNAGVPVGTPEVVVLSVMVTRVVVVPLSTTM